MKWKEERELEGIEATILAAEEEITRFEAQFADPNFYAGHGAEYSKLEAELRSARDRVAQLYARWEELGKIASAIKG